MINVLRVILLTLVLFILVPAIAGSFLAAHTPLGILIPSILISSLSLFVLAILYDKGKTPKRYKLNCTALISGLISLYYLLFELNDGITGTSIVLIMLILVSLVLWVASVNRERFHGMLMNSQWPWHIGRILLGAIVLITLIIPLITLISEMGLWVLHNLSGGGRVTLSGLRYFDIIINVTYSKQGIVLLAVALLIAITLLTIHYKKKEE